MTLSNMTAAEKSRWIAEKLEPINPQLELVRYLDCCKAGIRPRRFQYWLANQKLSDTELVAVDMVNDPAMTLMLMKWMPTNSMISVYHLAESVSVRVKRGVVYQVDLDLCVDKKRVIYMGESKTTIGEGVANAFMLANGWEDS